MTKDLKEKTRPDESALNHLSQIEKAAISDLANRYHHPVIKRTPFERYKIFFKISQKSQLKIEE